MAPTKLIAQLEFIDVPSGATVQLPHGLNVLGLPVIPDVVFPPNNADFEAIAGDATNLSVRNNGVAVASCSVQCWYWHSESRAMGYAVEQLPNPPYFIVGGGDIVNRHNIFTKSQGVAQDNLADNVLGVDTDATASNVFFLQLDVVAGNTRQLNAPTGLVGGFTYMWVFRQPVAGGEAVTFPGVFLFPNGVDMVLSGAGDAIDNMTCVAIDINPGGAPNIVLLDVSQLNYL